MENNYQKICSALLKDLPDRSRDVVVRRFGLEEGTRETLESIGSSYGITRERVRQIEAGGISKIKNKVKEDNPVFKRFKDFLKHSGGLRREDILLGQLGGEKAGSQVFFLMNISRDFKRFSETDDTHSFWTVDSALWGSAKTAIKSLQQRFKSEKKPLYFKDLSGEFSTKPETLVSFIEISKIIKQGPDGRFGLSDWPEINPRGIKDKAFLVFQKENKPLHFSRVAELIGDNALIQTVHNELIRDSRFVLVGRGTYALADWGYNPGTVKEVISDVLVKAKNPLSKEEILEEVLDRRLVKKNTILLNLSNKQHFLKNPQGKYFLRDA